LALGLAGAEETKSFSLDPNLPKVRIVTVKPERNFELGDGVEYSFEPSSLPADSVLAPEEKDQEVGVLLKGKKLFFLKTGKVQLPQRRVLDGAGAVVAYSDPIEWDVEEISIGQNEKPEGLAGPIAFRFPREWIYGLLGGSLLLLAFVIYRLKKWSEKRRLALQQIPEAPKVFYQICLGRIESTRQGPEWKDESFKKVAYQFSETLKEFISVTFQIPAEESTSVEVYRLLESLDKKEVSIDLEKIFSLLDLVKFTDFKASPDEMERIYQEVKQFIIRWKKEGLYAPR
jgi:hypothetical protein